MAITFLSEEYTPIGALSKSIQPYLQMAMQAQIQRRMADEQMKRQLQMEEQQRQQATERVKGFTPELFKEYGQIRRPKMIQPGKVPKQFLRTIDIEKAKQMPGLDLESMGFPYKVPSTAPTVGVYTTTPEGLPQRTGEVPRGSRVLTPSQMETPQAKQEREISTGKQKKAEEAKMEVQAIEGMVDSVWSKANELIPATEGTQQAAMTGLRKDIGTTKVGRLAGFSDENAITFREFKEGTLSMLIRSLGEKGMLTDQDITRARDFEPSNWDTPKIRRDKQIAMKEFLKSKISAYYQTIQQPQGSENRVGRFIVEVE